jgi:hypothetical protein
MHISDEVHIEEIKSHFPGAKETSSEIKTKLLLKQTTFLASFWGDG